MKTTLNLQKLKVASLSEKTLVDANSIKGGVTNDCHIIIPMPPPITMPCDQLSGNGGYTG